MGRAWLSSPVGRGAQPARVLRRPPAYTQACSRLPKQRELTFWVAEIDVPPPYKIYWKVKNVGPQAIERNMIRGEIRIDSGHRQITEHSTFQGDHLDSLAVNLSQPIHSRRKALAPHPPAINDGILYAHHRE
ncbi:nucleotide-binding domain-containing protein [Pseudomonas rubra]|uniref:Adenylyl/Guanylyl and SMODS C-terminal sensor domain-containing protein n=1 Tax=Pseudomonas rubra TaxID=2942627 RepID=A0ABT5P201_9PSED|nr:hypothetical protein [Pseudomonas rubra]MDD1012201.1 hypothetical protein [Pseudomonas rubra]MDD1038363.1 hypothetical protein [Pseudomonas rubra]MDD1153400.1 hypothetical protein [Pseudomonas rubra]